MYIIQMADLHIGLDKNLSEYTDKIDKLFLAISNIIKSDEKIIFCICGDIVDQGCKDAYSNAEKILNYIIEKFNGYAYSFEFIPGNHDICEGNFKEFDNFIKKYLSKPYSYEKENIIIREHDNISLILLNTAYHKDCKYGKIDLSRLKIVLQENQNSFVVMHHTFISEYEEDVSAVRDGYKFIRLLDENTVTALLHGHTHGYSDITISKDCKVIGVGPLFKKQDDINTQFNIIDIKSSKVDSILNMRYSLDLNGYDGINVFTRENVNVFYGDNIIDVYKVCVSNTLEQGCINNFNMNIRTSVDKFNEDIKQQFLKEIEIAEQWQEKLPPKTLYYNHGQYMFKADKDPIEYIVAELNKKATSSRAIIPLINMMDVVDSGDEFLPSLDIIQFGFKDESKKELYVTMYLRALEVNHFLKINIAEVYVMCKKICSKIRSISELNITIFSFRAQYKEKFSCFKKSDIDIIDESKLMIKVIKKDLKYIRDLLKNKMELAETVVHIEGVEKLQRCIKNYIEDEENEPYTQEIYSSLSNLIETMSSLKSLREETSNYLEIENKEQEVENKLKSLIENFEKILEE